MKSLQIFANLIKIDKLFCRVFYLVVITLIKNTCSFCLRKQGQKTSVVTLVDNALPPAYIVPAPCCNTYILTPEDSKSTNN